ncbi:hypothetical protein CHLNCDRAFT_9217, partial [Chlorella variabilis]
SDAASQAWLPVRLVKRARAQQERLPAVVLLHATGASKDSMATQQAEFARRGYLAVAVDCRYHGERSVDLEDCRGGYEQALVRAWRRSGERPFLLDNVWDLHRLLDWLQHRQGGGGASRLPRLARLPAQLCQPDVDAARIGMTGVSLGGMHTWLTAAADVRVAVAAPMIGVQHFGWAVQQQQYHGRVGSIPLVFQAAAADLAQQQQQGTAAGAEVSPEVVAAVWEQLLPGLLDRYDAPHSLPLLAPRPLLVANGEVDPRCPMQGVEVAMEAVRAAYERHGAADKLQLYVVPGCGHECTACM